MKEYNLDIQNLSPVEFESIQKSHKQLVEAENRRIEDMEAARKAEQQDYINKIRRARRGK